MKKVLIITNTLLTCITITFARHQNAIHLVPVVHPAVTTSDTSWTKKKATAWFNSHVWLNGLKLQPHQSTDQLEFARQYASNKSRWDKAFAYLKTTDLKAIKVGHYQIEGEDVYANVTEAPLKEFDQTQYEGHQNYADIHCMITGKEKIGVAPFDGASVKTPYDATKEVAFYNADGKIYTSEPGTFFIFCPGTLHRPSINVDGQGVVKKIVVKVKSAGK